jgi:type II secretory pathway predicted ATPase ExeA
MSAATIRWLAHFGMERAPFDKEVEDADLWVPSSRIPLIDELTQACHEHHHVLLTGEPGVGKTCVLRALRHRLQGESFRLTYCHNATLGRRDFYRQLCLAMGLSPKATAAAVFYEVSSHVRQLGEEHVHPVFLLDEAHLLHQDVLDHLHILANYEWDSRALLSLVLVGLPEMHNRMTLARNRSLWSRVQTRVQLGDAQVQDTAEYVAYRLRRAGADTTLFTADAVSMLHEASSGRLRDVERIAIETLKRAARRKLKKVDRQLIELALAADTID